MRPIIAIITIIGVISGFQLFAFAQGTENFEKRYEDSLIANQRRSLSEDQELEKRLFFGTIIRGLAKVGKAIGTAIHNRKHHHKRSYDESLEERDQLLERREELEKRVGLFSLFKVGKAIGTAIYNRKHHKRSYDESLEERDQLLERREELEKRLFFGTAIKTIFKVGKAIGTAIHNRKHHKRSYDELLEERDQLLELRDHLDGAHGYLAKRSDYDSLANDLVRRLVIQKRGVDYLLELNARDLDIDGSISDLD